MHTIKDIQLTNKRILLRVDFNVSLNAHHRIASDARIVQTLPTIEYLLKHDNQVIILSHLGRPHGIDQTFTLSPVARRLAEYMPGVTITLVRDLTFLPREITRTPKGKEIFVLENIRFFKGEERNDPNFAQELAKFGDVYVNDAFSVSHRKTASVVGLPKLLPHYAGLLMKKEVEALSHLTKHPESPFVAILGGAKVSSKIHLIEKLITLADIVLLGGSLANTFLLALGDEVGRSLVEKNEVSQAKKILALAEKKKTRLLLPTDVMVGDPKGRHAIPKFVQNVAKHDVIFDIGPHTWVMYEQALAQAKTILWNGPMGLFETAAYKHGTDSMYEAITKNEQAVSIVGGGETLSALSHKHHLEKISHISTGGGAMLEFIEHGTLPGIEALKA